MAGLRRTLQASGEVRTMNDGRVRLGNVAGWCDASPSAGLAVASLILSSMCFAVDSLRDMCEPSQARTIVS